ncbi:LacI family transcriptional regulator [Vibrio natriegens]|jgi:LacI family transcriptional regulator|uniref:LacI family DNA-binding transcriptional regulator n=1 Tax=Vibrio natriegens TaxID=691 RepID=UPI000803C62E|nr:LacI family DNA-binding transcriptional regulator [Vibrio natriegens]ANQ23799.1 LacI family transcriptional regulator [Vibrio natriegens]MCY9876953.1 LacI family DNA-binding transcriptional regulator [Vibrio natriegens]
MKSKSNQLSSRVTAKDVAERAGVSKWTVNRAFNENAPISSDTKTKVLKAADELGYRPNLLARSLSNQSTNICGIVVDEMDNPHLAVVLNEVTTQLQQRGYTSLLLNISSESNSKNVLKLADQLQVAGLIFLGTILSEELVSIAQDIHNISLVQIYRNNVNSRIQVVATNGYSAGQEVGKLFCKEGYRSFGYLKGADTESWELLRLDGYRDYLYTQGLELNEILISYKYDYESGYETVKNYLKNTPPTEYFEALFCENDIIAMGAIDAIKDHGNGIKIAVVGFDDIDLAAASSYNLTTYRQPRNMIVSKAIDRLLAPNLAKNKELLTGELVLRESHKR